MVYVPSADEAYSCLEYLNFEQPLGWFLRALHFWAATGMVVMLVVHMTQVFLFAAYKYPRELTWLCGVVLFADRSLEPKELTPYQPLLDAGLI